MWHLLSHPCQRRISMHATKDTLRHWFRWFLSDSFSQAWTLSLWKRGAPSASCCDPEDLPLIRVASAFPWTLWKSRVSLPVKQPSPSFHSRETYRALWPPEELHRSGTNLSYQVIWTCLSRETTFYYFIRFFKKMPQLVAFWEACSVGSFPIRQLTPILPRNLILTFFFGLVLRF